MARKKVAAQNFLTSFINYTSSELTDAQKVHIARRTYLVENKSDIIKAVDMGYNYHMLAKFITEQLLKTDIPKVFVRKNKEGEEIEVETKMAPSLIKEFYEKEMQK
jgi:hypothetical protein